MRLVQVRRVAVVKTIAASEQNFDTERACFTLPLGTGSLPLPLTLFSGPAKVLLSMRTVYRYQASYCELSSGCDSSPRWRTVIFRAACGGSDH